MIFAVLGVIILIVSFSIALFSLIKEQNQFSDREEELKKPEKASLEKVSEKELEDIEKPDVVTSLGHRETYIWEQHRKIDADKISKFDEEKEIREIEARLAQIKSEGSKSQVAIDKKQEQSEQVSQRSNLSGSFSISDMLKEL